MTYNEADHQRDRNGRFADMNKPATPQPPKQREQECTGGVIRLHDDWQQGRADSTRAELERFEDSQGDHVSIKGGINATTGRMEYTAEYESYDGQCTLSVLPADDGKLYIDTSELVQVDQQSRQTQAPYSQPGYNPLTEGFTVFNPDNRADKPPIWDRKGRRQWKKERSIYEMRRYGGTY